MSIFPIPWEDTLEGCRLCIENAERLAEDSRVLRASGRLQSAFSVSLDAWEELSKAVILYRYYKTKENVCEDDWYSILRDHKRKRVAWANSVDLLYGTSPPKSITDLKDDLQKAIAEDDNSNWFNLEREVAVYVDWIGGEDRWRSPCKIDEWWFEAVPFDSNYWALATVGQCKHLRGLLPLS